MNVDRPVIRVFAALRRRGCEWHRVARSPRREWQAQCPAHVEDDLTLKVWEKSDGIVLLYDHGGCPTTAVLAALGLRWRDLFPARASAP